MKPVIDSILKFMISKKLSIMIIATVLIFYDKISGTQWMNVAVIYIGGQTIIDAIIKLRSK